MTISVVEEKVEPKSFFSPSAGLTLNYKPGHHAIVDGKMTFINDKHIAFVPLGSADAYGHYRTNDPDEIAYLEKRIVECGDVFDSAEYNKRIVPTNVQFQDAQRTIEIQNKLIEKLKAQQDERERLEREAANPARAIKPPVTQPTGAKE